MTARRGFGKCRKLPSGRWQASYVGPDGRRRTAPSTFGAKIDAAAWLAAQQTDIARGTWGEPAPVRRELPAFAAYAARWMRERELRGRSRREYRSILGGHLLPPFGELRLDQITPALVREWHASYGTRTPSARSKAYRLMHAIMQTAFVDDELVAFNPCRIRKGGSDPRQRTINVATEVEVDLIADAIRPEWRLLVLLAAYTALRFGELTELRQRDIDLQAQTISVERAASRAESGPGIVVGPPKSAAGVRKVFIPETLLDELTAHLALYAQPGPDGLLFTTHRGAQLYQSCFHREWKRARAAAGRPDLRFHDLRHTGATWLAESGAPLPVIMRQVGHSTPTMAIRYQHATDEAARQYAGLMSARRTGAR
jgi:integrase